ncbi:Putative NADH dehydrogenase [ubiquinone] 1 beta subcomplex subunit 8 [Septoria linicola]|uniref:NADH dehydrogenase [ubiquinone] 1 beta subcomplex subunit 8 n=1 Tax=Septoria linicola TaxID=215465 RepID=A0A9Q9EKL6_9PEZI|nr:Putative NADH dehydrogenase [ubiquinone] 1 beta subcomplex subunit 8 [Septoria linicola]
MASLRTAVRLAPRAQFVRPSTTSSNLAKRSYASASATRRPATDNKSAGETEQASEDLGIADPNMNGNYPDPSLTSALPVKRQFRDPYGDWWDKQERRNYGEPVHEDNDILGIFSPESYTHFTPGWGGILFGTFVGAVGVLCAVTYRFYPDRPSVARTFPDGLEAELGGPKAVRARNQTEGDVGRLDRHIV